MTFVVDTNVAIAANGRGTHADVQCRLTCVRRLRSLVAGEVVAIDETGLVLNEYKKHLNFSGMPGVGDMFFKHVFNNPVVSHIPLSDQAHASDSWGPEGFEGPGGDDAVNSSGSGRRSSRLS